MVVIEVYTKNIKVKYKSTLFSKATLISVMSGIISVILPYIFAYESGGLWMKWNVFYEQPKVDMRGEYLFVAMTDNLSNPIICSTYAFYKEHLNHLDSCALIKLREIDNNFDGKTDTLSLSVRINLLGNKMTSISFILPVNYTLNTFCPFRMQSAIFFQHYFHQLTATDLHVMADLNLYQSSAIFCNNHFYDTSIIGDEEESENFELESIIGKYVERNVTTHLTNIYTNIKSENKNVFNLKLSVRYPEHKIFFQTGFWQIIKMAWIQYFAILVIVIWFIEKIKDYIFNNRLVLFYEESPLKKNS